MIPIIDKDYFWGENEITGLNQSNPDNVLKLDRYILKYQNDYFIRMFGEDIAANIPDELIAMLRNEELKTSPLANYVYYWWNRAEVLSKATNTGQKRIDIQNTQVASPIGKMVSSWNEMVRINKKIHDTLYKNTTLTVAAKGDVETYDITYVNDILPNIDPVDDDIFNILWL